MAEDFDDIISPPSMFKPQFLFNQSAQKIQERDGAVAKKHQPDHDEINVAALHSSQSTTELYIEPQRASGGSDSSKAKRPGSIRRCISYQYVQMSNAHNDHTPATHSSKIASESSGSSNGNSSNNNNHLDRNIPIERTHRHQQQLRKENNQSSSSKCKCCESSQCPSPRSSDSGMAGSCTITSPDPPHGNYYAGEDLPTLATTNSDSNDISDLTRFDVCGMFRAKFLTPEATQDLIDNTDSIESFHHIQQHNAATSNNATIKAAPISTLTTAELQISASSTTIDSVASSSSHQMMTNSQGNMQFSSSLDGINSPAMTSTADGPLFRSGMYAHWWKKEKLPPAVVRGIAKALQSTQLSKDSRCSMCSSCASCVSGGGSGFSEGTAYSSLCRECVCFCRSNSGGENSTNTTTTTSMVQCPLCSADDCGITDIKAASATHSERASRSSFGNAGAVTATTSSTSTVSSPSSSLDCPICKGLITRGNSLCSLQLADDDDGVKLSAEGYAGDASSAHLNCANCSDSVVEGKQTLLTHACLTDRLATATCHLLVGGGEAGAGGACGHSIVLTLINKHFVISFRLTFDLCASCALF